MKNITIIASLISCSFFAQTNIEKLPSFYDQSEGNKIVSVDMIGDGIEPYVIYTTFNHNDVKCKVWDGQDWTTFGVFPKLDNRGVVKIAKNKNDFYALAQTQNSWSVFKKEGDDWKAFGGDLIGAKDLSDPVFTFIDEVPVIYEVHYRNRNVIAYTYKGGKFQNITSILAGLGEVSSDFVMAGEKVDQMVLAFTQSGEKPQIFDIEYSGSEATEESITKGLKVKDLNTIEALFYSKGKLRMFYFNNSWELQAAIFDKSSKKWEIIGQTEVIDELGFYLANDLSFVSKDRDSDLPVFYKYNGKNWNKGIEIGSEKIYQGREVLLAEGLGQYYLLHFDGSGEKTIVQKITID